MSSLLGVIRLILLYVVGRVKPCRRCAYRELRGLSTRGLHLFEGKLWQLCVGVIISDASACVFCLCLVCHAIRFVHDGTMSVGIGQKDKQRPLMKWHRVGGSVRGSQKLHSFEEEASGHELLLAMEHNVGTMRK